jgi:STE24 endopeptidase
MIAINTFLGTYLALYLFTAAADLFIGFVNARHLMKKDRTVPEVFQSVIDEKRMEKMSAYTLDNTVLGALKTLTGKVVFLGIILSGLLPWLAEALKDLSLVPAGLIFFAVPALLGAFAEIPFDYYQIFVIEERYGFNTSTLTVWLSDLLKSCLLALVLGTVLLSALFLLVRYGGGLWWIWAWGLFFSFQLLIAVIYPTLIAPLFNKFTPFHEGVLAEKIRALAEREKVAVKGIFQMDATKRSRHTNAYLSGLGRAKRIVLFDSLVSSHEDEEILAVLGHEIGHLKRHHMGKQLLLLGVTSFGLLYLASVMMKWEMMYGSFGFSGMPLYAGIFLVAVLWDPVEFFFSPAAMALSRRFEREADAHAMGILKTPGPFIEALKKMARDNLANLQPHPLYVRFNYSHPPLEERIRNIDRMGAPERNPGEPLV